jgi:hypothetical protein
LQLVDLLAKWLKISLYIDHFLEEISLPVETLKVLIELSVLFGAFKLQCKVIIHNFEGGILFS